jgi:hypothetical protein
MACPSLERQNQGETILTGEDTSKELLLPYSLLDDWPSDNFRKGVNG